VAALNNNTNSTADIHSGDLGPVVHNELPVHQSMQTLELDAGGGGEDSGSIPLADDIVMDDSHKSQGAQGVDVRSELIEPVSISGNRNNPSSMSTRPDTVSPSDTSSTAAACASDMGNVQPPNSSQSTMNTAVESAMTMTAPALTFSTTGSSGKSKPAVFRPGPANTARQVHLCSPRLLLIQETLGIYAVGSGKQSILGVQQLNSRNIMITSCPLTRR